MVHPKVLEKQKPKISGRKEIIKIKEEVIKIETKEIT